METYIEFTIASVNVSILLGWLWYQMFGKPLVFDEPKPNYDEETDWLLSLDETEKKISE